MRAISGQDRRAIATVDLHFDDGVVLARQRARDLASLLGFDAGTQTRIATAVSELARNAKRYAGSGNVNFGVGEDALVIEVVDRGPGVSDIDAVLAGNYRSSTGMGQGLVGVRRLMDTFEIETGKTGTRVQISKRLPKRLSDAQAAYNLRTELSRRGSRSAYDEVQSQNQELLQALSELRVRQDELVHLNAELEETNRGVVALYAELDERAEQLRDADSRKSRFLADMSHELRAPLNSIVALSDLLHNGRDPLTDEQRTQIEFIRRMATDQLQLVGELLDLAKIEAGRAEVTLRAVSVPEVFAVLRPQLRPLAAGPDVALVFSAEPGLPQLVTDERKLIHILRNLIGNALKYTNEGEVLITAAAASEGLEIAVIDSGVGIAEPDLERIFDEFIQIDGEHQRRVQGTGLGLPLVRKLAELLGGSVTAQSTLGLGSRFVVALPWKVPEQLAGRAVWGAAASAESKPDFSPYGTQAIDLVLIADDDEAARYVVRQQLAQLVGELIEADGGEAALRLVKERAPSAVILDLTMPDLSGLEVLAKLRALPGLQDIPVIVHTSKELDTTERDEIHRLGAVVVAKAEASATRLLTAILEHQL